MSVATIKNIDDLDAIYDACVAKGSTPASHSVSDIVDAINNIRQGLTSIPVTVVTSGTSGHWLSEKGGNVSSITVAGKSISGANTMGQKSLYLPC